MAPQLASDVDIPSALTLDVETTSGLVLVGRLLGLRDARPWNAQDGSTVQPVDVGVDVGERTETVQYYRRAAAEAAVAGVGHRGPIALPVEYKSGVSEKNGRPYAFLIGRRESSPDGGGFSL